MILLQAPVLSGVLVKSVEPKREFAVKGFKAGDRIVGLFVGRALPIRSVTDWNALLRNETKAVDLTAVLANGRRLAFRWPGWRPDPPSVEGSLGARFGLAVPGVAATKWEQSESLAGDPVAGLRFDETFALEAEKSGMAVLYAELTLKVAARRLADKTEKENEAPRWKAVRDSLVATVNKRFVRDEPAAFRLLATGMIPVLYSKNVRPNDVRDRYAEDVLRRDLIWEDAKLPFARSAMVFEQARLNREVGGLGSVATLRGAYASVGEVRELEGYRSSLAIALAERELAPDGGNDALSARRLAGTAAQLAYSQGRPPLAATARTFQALAARRSGLTEEARSAASEAISVIDDRKRRGWDGSPTGLPPAAVERLALIVRATCALRTFDTDLAEKDFLRASRVRETDGGIYGRVPDADMLAATRAAAWVAADYPDVAAPYLRSLPPRLPDTSSLAWPKAEAAAGFWGLMGYGVRASKEVRVTQQYPEIALEATARRGFARWLGRDGKTSEALAQIEAALGLPAVSGSLRDRAALHLDRAVFMTALTDDRRWEAWKLAVESAARASFLAVGESGRSAAGAAISRAGNGWAMALAKDGKSEEAIDVLEATRARALSQTLADRNSFGWNRMRYALARYEAANIDIAECEEGLRKIRERLSSRSRISVAEVNRLNTAAADLSRRLTEAIAEREAARPDLERLDRESRATPPRATPRGRLPDDMAVVVYAVAPDGLLMMVTKNGAAPVAETASVSQDVLDRLFADYRDAIQRASASASERARLERALVARIFPPKIVNALKDRPRWAIVPDRGLWEIPFGALTVPGLGRDPLGVSRSLVMTYARETLFGTRGRSDSGSVAVFGDAEFVDLPRLPGTGREAKAVAELHGARPVLTKAATEREFRRRLPGAKLVHVATHGTLDASEPLAASVRFTKGPGKDPADDGIFRAAEATTLPNLSADLVVLSACETGRGRLTSGEGVLGLTRAFIGAGARNVVASLWRVNDNSAAILMKSFHAAYKRGERPERALRSAIVELRKDKRYSTPNHWAAFMVYGGVDSGK